MSGMMAQVAASAYPERVLSLTSIMSSSGNPSLPQASPDAMAMMTKPAPNLFEDEAGSLGTVFPFVHAYECRFRWPHPQCPDTSAPCLFIVLLPLLE